MHRTQVVAAGARTMGSLHPTLLHATPFALVFLLCACVAPGPTREGDVQIAPVQPDDAPTFTLGADQRFIFGRPIADQRAMPAYPASALAARLPPLSVCVELETDEEGRVTAARPLDLAGSCAPAPRRAWRRPPRVAGSARRVPGRSRCGRGERARTRR